MCMLLTGCTNPDPNRTGPNQAGQDNSPQPLASTITIEILDDGSTMPPTTGEASILLIHANSSEPVTVNNANGFKATFNTLEENDIFIISRTGKKTVTLFMDAIGKVKKLRLYMLPTTDQSTTISGLVIDKNGQPTVDMKIRNYTTQKDTTSQMNTGAYTLDIKPQTSTHLIGFNLNTGKVPTKIYVSSDGGAAKIDVFFDDSIPIPLTGSKQGG